jgi:citrate lyase beta subunit
MPTVLNDDNTRAQLARLSQENREFAAAYPGDRADRQPVHTVYGGAQLFTADIAQKLGAAALRAFDTYAPDARTLGAALALPGHGAPPTDPASRIPEAVHARVREKLEREAVEDYRIDFEDGYGNRPDDEEDGHARACAEEVAAGMRAGTLPPFIGIRVKPFNEELHGRGLRTLDLFFATLLARTKGELPPRFVVTLPKVTVPAQVETLVVAFELIERAHGLREGALELELMVEMPQSILTARGEIGLPRLIAAARGRCRGAHFGTYDYTAGCTITAAYQLPQHPACDFARHVLQVCAAQTGVWISDGATTVMPVAPHRAPEGGSLTAPQLEENRRAIHHAWKVHYDDVRSSLRHAYYQGWDLHPAQLPTRYAAVSAFFLESRDSAAERLRRFVEKAAQATLLGNVFDDAATGQGLLNFFLRGLSCGALTEGEALATGLTIDELRSRSFVKILAGRRRV